MPKLFALTGVEALRNGHIIRSQRLRMKKIVSFSKHLEIPEIIETTTFQSSGHPVHSGGDFFNLQAFLRAGSVWKVFIVKVDLTLV